jgi:tetratricopeptide (TPR) repeat protein
MKHIEDLSYLHQISAAKAAFSAREFDRAKSICNELLRENKGDVSTLHLLGFVCLGMGDIPASIRAFEAACLSDSSNAKLFSDLAVALVQAGRKPEAVEALSRAVVLLPGFADANANLSAVFADLGQWLAAEHSGRKALAVSSSHVGALVNLSRVLGKRGDREGAFHCLYRGLVLDPSRPEGWYACAMNAHAVNALDQARTAVARAINLGWRIFECALTQGAIFVDLRLFETAIVPNSKVIALDPACEPGFSNLAAALANSEDPEAGVIAGQRAVTINPLSGPAFFNLGTALRECLRYEECLEALASARVVGYDTAEVRFVEANCQLLTGDFAMGWQNYEARWESKSNRFRMDPLRWLKAMPEFSGVGRQRVLVWAEQGVGDEVMFGSLLPEFRALCGEMLVQVDRRLKDMFARSLPGVQVFDCAKSIPRDLYDEQISMGSLGKLLRPNKESFFGKGGRYLAARPGLGRRLRAELGVEDGQILVGVSWRSVNAETGVHRSLSLYDFMSPLFGREGFRFLNLQYGDVEREIETLRVRSGIEVLSHPKINNLQDLDGLAGLIEGCDLVVSIGNATAHLSGALGQKTWVLLPYVAGWRWLHEGDACPWYESVRLYRQIRRRSWHEVMSQVSQDLSVFES